MINGKRLIAIIPARANSTRIKNKNLKKIGKYSLVENTIRYAKSLNYIDEIIVSTDSKKINTIAKKYKINDNELRPKFLSGKFSLTSKLVLYLIKKKRLENDYILLLQCTSPLRKKIDFYKLIKKFKLTKSNAILSVVKNNFAHPFKSLKKKKNRFIEPFFKKETNVPSQKLQEAYISNGAFYLISAKNLIKYKTFIPNKTSFYVMPYLRSINIDYPEDIKIAKVISKVK